MSAVAVILSLLIIVTFIATYLSTTLPNTMGGNDLQHEVQVENQVAQVSSILRSAAANAAIGAQVSQPITLGSLGSPPFAPPDGASLTPLAFAGNTTGNFPQSTLAFNLTGPTVYIPPKVGTQGGIAVGCATTSSTITCSGAATVVYNFTGTLANQSTYALTLSGGGSAKVNFSASHSVITVTASSTTHITLYVSGSNDTVSVTVSSVPETILVTGNYDTVTVTGSAAPSSQTNILVLGNHDTVSTSAISGTNTIVASVYGSNDTVNPGVLSGTNKFSVYFNGFNLAAPALSCPVDNLSRFDTVSQPTGTGTFSVTYNNTVYSGSGTNGAWTVAYRIPTASACPFVSTVTIGVAPTSNAGFSVQLHNTYVSAAEVAYDEGAVVYAQPGGLPLFIVPPQITFANGVLTLFLPRFTNTISGESGTGTADMTFQLVDSVALSLPAGGFSFLSGSSLTLKVVTPYAAAWYAYYETGTTLSPYVTCSGPNSVCTALYQTGGARPLGTITFTIPTAGLTLRFLSGWFAVGGT
ncbi:MAG TPA: hypothetical protein VEG42_05395 [Thermoplasmata archaeon]|nr:hypothetical protein [Thermoplasmata archaeon]